MVQKDSSAIKFDRDEITFVTLHQPFFCKSKEFAEGGVKMLIVGVLLHYYYGLRRSNLIMGDSEYILVVLSVQLLQRRLWL